MSENSLAMMPWFPRDFIAATRALRIAERGAYRELLDFQWEMGKLPAQPARLALLLGVPVAEFAKIWPAIKDKFKPVDGGIANKRLEEHRKFALEQRDRKRRGAQLTNAKRVAERTAERTAERDGQRVASESPPSPSPSPSISEEKRGEPRAAHSATHLPDQFDLTPERRSVAETERIDPERTFANFCDYWRSASGARARKRNWDAAWRVWCRNDKGMSNGAHKQRPKPSAVERVYAATEHLIGK